MRQIISMIKGVWTGRFIYWWAISLLTILLFDVFWMMQTTFRPFTYYVFWPYLLLSSFFISFPSVFSRRGIYSAIWLFFIDWLLIANLMYCRTYYSAIPLNSYLLIGNLADFTASVTDSFKWYFIFLPILTVIASLYYHLGRKVSRKQPNPVSWLLYMLIFFIAGWLGDALRLGTVNKIREMSESSNLKGAVVPIYSLGGFLAYDYYKGTEKLTPEKLEDVKDWIKTHQDMAGTYWTDSTKNIARVPKNLVLILCESLESWVVENVVEGKEVTPNLTRYVNDSTTFYAPNVVTQVGSGHSIEAQLLILSGLHPMYNKVYAYDAIDNRYFTLPLAMEEQGAKTYLLTADKPYVWNQEPVSRAFGWQHLVHNYDFDNKEPVGIFRLLSDGQLMSQTVEKMKSGEVWPEGEKAMIMTVTFSGHSPFVLPEYLRKIKFDDDYSEEINHYMMTANYTDYSIGELIDYLKTRKDWEETMVVITGDHEGLGSTRHLAVKHKKAGKFVDPGQHTPLIILNSPRPGRYEDEMGQLDIYSTLIDLMGLKDYAWKGMGFSIFDPNAPRYAFGTSGGNMPEVSGKDTLMYNHLKDARNISDIILKFNLLQNYPDSIGN